MKKYTIKLPHPFAVGLCIMIETLLASPDMLVTDQQKMHTAILAEIENKLSAKTKYVQKHHKLSCSPAQAFALRIFFVEYATTPTAYMDNKMLQIANQIHQHYA